MRTSPAQYTKGSLLIEVLLAISVLAVILSLGAESSYVSLVGTKAAAEKDVASGLLTEQLSAVRSISDEKWQNIFSITKGSANTHFATTTAGKWGVGATASETVTINGVAYTRYFFVQDVCRGAASPRAITGITDSSGTGTTCTTSGGGYDPSTEKVTITITWGGGNTLSMNEYLIRWRNKVCDHTDWSGGAVSGTAASRACGYNAYDTSTNLGTPNTSLQIQ